MVETRLTQIAHRRLPDGGAVKYAKPYVLISLLNIQYLVMLFFMTLSNNKTSRLITYSLPIKWEANVKQKTTVLEFRNFSILFSFFKCIILFQN